MQTPTIDPEAPLLVAKATGTLALAGAATGGTIAVLRGQQPLGFVFTMGLNGAVAGLSFFGEPFSSHADLWSADARGGR
jgi:hypothetical protein